MSKSQRSNPFDYKLPMLKSWDGNPQAFRPYEKKVKLICKSFMKRTRAAYKHAAATIKDRKEIFLTVTTAACDLEEHINGVYEWVMQNLPLRAIKWDDGRTLSQAAKDHIDYVNKGILRMHAEIKNFETYAYNKERRSKYWHDTVRHQDIMLKQAQRHRAHIKTLFLDARKNYPYIRDKYRNRLMRLALAEVAKGNRSGRVGERDMTMTDLLKIGIPAVDIVGPWWPRTADIKSPMDYVDFTDRHSDIRIPGRLNVSRGVSDSQAPSVDDWLAVIDLDSGDRELREVCFQYYLRHKAAPSVKWARERSNQLEQERAKKEIEEQIPSVRLWLEYVESWLDDKKIVIPILPGSEWKVLGPKDAENLCETAKRDGLCVLDVISHFVGDAHDEGVSRKERIWRNSDAVLKRCDEEGVCSLVLCTDPKRRTIVGLDKDGVCTSAHHCTGVRNEVDKDAWEYFRKRG